MVTQKLDLDQISESIHTEKNKSIIKQILLHFFVVGLFACFDDYDVCD